jgi:2-polyprenyl-6-methoxyphenol hydroxylase-like FAD-dependent oxidoreductase
MTEATAGGFIMNSTADIPVLICGAGPTGLMLASELVRHGMRVRIVDKAPGPAEQSRALGMQARMLEVFDSIGLADTMIAHGHKVHGVNAFAGGKRIAHISFDEIESPYRFVLVIPQSQTERILIEHLASLGVSVERGVELTGFTQDADSVAATLRMPDGREESCRSSWIAGCDGAHSVVRQTLGLPFEGIQYDEAFWLIDCHMDWSQPDDELYLYPDADRLFALFPMGNGRWRVVATIDANDNREPALESVETALRALGLDLHLHDPTWLSHFRINRLRVTGYRVGRAFVCGDAAHVHSPAGGQGMNTGLQDAHNLAWKLALAESGAARPELLDTFHAERHPIAVDVLETSDLLTRFATMRNPVAKAIRDRLAPVLTALEVVQHRASRTISELVVNYRTSPIVGEHRSGLVENLRRAGGAGVGAWYDFAHGPAAGDHAPDAEPIELDHGSADRLYDLLRGTTHTLLLFSGVDSGEDCNDLLAIAHGANDRFPDQLRAYLVMARDQSEASADLPKIRDFSHAMHRRYGAGARCLYLIRPDAYVGFRSQPAETQSLLEHLARIFK